MSKLPGRSDHPVATIIDETQKITPFRKPVKCPNCKNISSRNTYPFCSKHCADVDLGRWFNGSYAIDQ